MNIRGVPLRLVDTAGIRQTEDIVERIGVERSQEVLKDADLILLILNGSEPLTAEDHKLFKAIEGMEAIVIVNKNDLEQQLSFSDIKSYGEHLSVIETSLIKDEGIDQLEKAISDLFFSGGIESQDETYVSNARHVALLNQARQSVEEAKSAIESGMPVDMAQIDITRAWETLGEIIGDTVSDSLIDQLFSQFCLGK